MNDGHSARSPCIGGNTGGVEYYPGGKYSGMCYGRTGIELEPGVSRHHKAQCDKFCHKSDRMLAFYHMAPGSLEFRLRKMYEE